MREGESKTGVDEGVWAKIEVETDMMLMNVRCIMLGEGITL